VNQSPIRFMSRRYYAWTMFAILVLHLILGAIIAMQPVRPDFARYYGGGEFAAIAIFTGARLADAGYKRWKAILAVILIGLILPLVVFICITFVFGIRIANVSNMETIAGASMLPLIAFVIWAATRPSVVGASDDRRDSEPGDRIEPRF